MHHIRPSWSTGSNLRLVPPPRSHHHRYHSILPRHVSVKRLIALTPLGRSVSVSRRAFTRSCPAGLSSQAAQPSRQEDDEDNHVAQQDTSYQVASSYETKSTAEQSLTSDKNVLEDCSDGQVSFSLNQPHLPYHDSVLQVPVNEEDFAILNGFWPTHTSNQSLTTPAPRTPVVRAESFQSDCGEQIEQSSPTLPTPQDSVLKKLWRSQPRLGKMDLSHHNPARIELQENYDGQPEPEPVMTSRGFRDSSGPRKLIAIFAEQIYPHTSSTVGLTDSAVEALLTHPSFAHIKTDDHDAILQMLSWSWIVLAPPAQRLKRLVYWSRSEHGHVTPNVPQWLVLQLLRSERVDSGDLDDLLQLIDQRRERWSSTGSTMVSIMVLIVRLLRHARLSDATCFSRIVELFMRLLDHHLPCQLSIEDARRRAHACNRVLTLIGLPVDAHPFKHVMMQQGAQLLLLRYMHDVSPTIPLNREGYRALTSLQLMHKKTDSEKAWAKVQTHTWPPWEQEHQMGVASPPRQSPGSTSRTNLVLQRMREDGYSPHTFDAAAQVLGGRDLDGSPTIQVRRTPSANPASLAWSPGLDSTHFQKSDQIWKARVTATRSVREAWMGLLAYEDTVRDTGRAACVYHAMFEKLWAGTVSAESDDGPLPGDGLENFPDPELARDRVHVTEEPPSVKELYQRMKDQGIKPSGPLLRDLLLHQDNLPYGLEYIADSPMESTLKTVLTNPMDHSPMEVAATLKKLGKETREAYISLLARPHSKRLRNRQPLFRCDATGKYVPGPMFALRVLYHAACSESSIWAKYFASLSRHSLPSPYRERINMGLAWRLMCDSYALEKRNLNAAVLSHVFLLAWNYRTWVEWKVEEDTRYEPLDMSMRFFMEAVSGARDDATASCHKTWARCMRKTRLTLYSVPTVDEIQMIAFIMVVTQRETMIQDILELLHWANEHQRILATVSGFTKRNLAAFRVYLEGQWATFDSDFMELGLEVMIANPEQISEAKEVCQQLGGWASDEDVDQYLQSSYDMFKRVKRKLEADAQIA